MDKKLWKISGTGAFFASLCCLSPLLLFIFGLSSAAFASSLADTFYGSYKWVFRGIGLLLLMIGIIYYYRQKGVCTFDQAKRRRNEIINTTLIVLIVGIIFYVIFLYVILHYWGAWLELWPY